MKKILLILLQLTLFCSISLIFAAEGEEGDESWRSLLQQIERNNRELLLKRAETGITAGKVDQAIASRFPVLDFTSTMTYQANPRDGIYLNTADLSALMPPSGGAPPPDKIQIMEPAEAGYYKFSLELTQPVFTWGKLAWNQKIWETKLQADRIGERILVQDLLTEAVVSLYSLSMLNLMERELENQIEAMQAIEEFSQAGYNRGLFDKRSLLDITYNRLALETALIEIRSNFQSLEIGIANMAGLDYWSSADVLLPEFPDISQLLQEWPIPDFESTHAQTLTENPVLDQLTQVSAIRDLELDIARSSHPMIPDLAFQTELSYSGSRFPFIEKDWYRQNDYALNLTLAVTTTVTDSGYTRGHIKEAMANSDAADLNREVVFSQLSEICRTTWEEVVLARERITLQRQKVELSQEKMELVEQKYLQGEILEPDYQNQKIVLAQDRAALLEETLNYLTHWYALRNLSGSPIIDL